LIATSEFRLLIPESGVSVLSEVEWVDDIFGYGWIFLREAL
jgi:hypothetical protein